MATIGHTLVGLTASTMRRGDLRVWPSLAWWPGVLVLGAHLPDVVEWILSVAGIQAEHSHQFHSIRACLACVAAGSLLMLVIGRIRSPLVHLVWAGAVFSHLALDSSRLGYEIRVWYRDPPAGQELQARGLDLPAEIWFFGIAPVLALLVQVVVRTKSTSLRQHRLRQAALLAMPVVIAAFFVPSQRAVWLGVNCLAVAFSAWALGWRARAAWLWNLVPIAPILALGVIEAWAGFDVQRALALESQGRYAEAAARLKHAVDLPTRTGKVVRLWDLGRAYERQGRWREAEEAYQRCVTLDNEWNWSEIILADFYLRARGTSAYRPAEAVRLLRRVAEGDRPEFARSAARWRLKTIESAFGHPATATAESRS